MYLPKRYRAQREESRKVPLGKVCTVVGGGTPRRNNPAYFGGNIPWATPSDVTALDGLLIERTKENLTDIGLRESSARLVPAGTVLMTSRATIGYTAIATVPMATNQGFANLTCSEAVEPEYLAFWLRYRKDELIQLAAGTTFKEIPKSTLKKILIPLPPLHEQRRIAGILNRASHIERLRARATDRLQQFIPALFLKMFGDPVENYMRWEILPLQEVVREIRNGSTAAQNLDGKGYKVTRIETIKDGYIDSNRVRYVELSDAELIKWKLEENDILFSHINSVDHIGKSAIYTGTPEILIHGMNLLKIRINETIFDPLYFSHFLKSNSTRSLLRSRSKRAINQASINQRELGALPVPIPPLEQQRCFAAIVARVQRAIDNTGTAAKTAAALSASLVDRLIDP